MPTSSAGHERPPFTRDRDHRRARRGYDAGHVHEAVAERPESQDPDGRTRALYRRSIGFAIVAQRIETRDDNERRRQAAKRGATERRQARIVERHAGRADVMIAEPPDVG